VLIAIFGLVSLGVAAPQDAHKPLRCGSETKLDTVLNHPQDYFGKTVTVEGEMHRTFSDKVFSIEDDDFLRDDDLLIITNSSKSDVVKPVKDSIEEGKDVCVTGVIQPFHRSEMESKFGPLNIESRASHYKEGSPVMIIEKSQAVADTATTFDREQPVAQPAPEPAPQATAEPQSEPVPSQLETKSNEQELPATASPLPLIGLGGLLSMLAAAGIHIRRR
jgi:hypothetical protein